MNEERARPDDAGPKKHKVTLNLDKAVWQELEDVAETEGVEPKDIIVRLLNEYLGGDPELVDAGAWR